MNPIEEYKKIIDTPIKDATGYVRREGAAFYIRIIALSTLFVFSLYQYAIADAPVAYLIGSIASVFFIVYFSITASPPILLNIDALLHRITGPHNDAIRDDLVNLCMKQDGFILEDQVLTAQYYHSLSQQFIASESHS